MNKWYLMLALLTCSLAMCSPIFLCHFSRGARKLGPLRHLMPRHPFLRHQLCFIDTDECFENNASCHAKASCINQIGSFKCSCNSGYSGNGTFCEGLFGYVVILLLAVNCNSLLNRALEIFVRVYPTLSGAFNYKELETRLQALKQ